MRVAEEHRLVRNTACLLTVTRFSAGERHESDATGLPRPPSQGYEVMELVIIDRDLFAIPPAQIKEAKVLLTMVGGRVTHAAEPFKR